LRGGGAVESREERTHLPVLRDNVAGADTIDGERCGGGCRTRPGGGVARDSGRAAGMAGGEGVGSLPELPGDIGIRSGTNRAAVRFLRLDGVPAGKPAADEDERGAGAGCDPAMVREPVVRAECAQERGAHGHGKGTLYSVLDVRRAGACGLDGGERVL